MFELFLVCLGFVMVVYMVLEACLMRGHRRQLGLFQRHPQWEMYRYHVAEIQHNPDTGVYEGRVLNIPEELHFAGATLPECLTAFHREVDQHVQRQSDVGAGVR